VDQYDAYSREPEIEGNQARKSQLLGIPEGFPAVIRLLVGATKIILNVVRDAKDYQTLNRQR
jgi:hypothetical protein